MNRRLAELKKKYEETPIPEELDAVVMNAVRSRKLRALRIRRLVAAAAAVILGFGLSVNISPAFAQAVYDLPVIGGLARVITLRQYRFETEKYRADIVVPGIESSQAAELADRLNAKYLAEGRELYAKFMAEMEEMKQAGDGHLSVSSGYIVKTDNEQILSVGRWVVTAMGSASNEIKYDTIDKQNQLLITLPMLFKDDDYIEIISENIKAQMREQMAAGEGMIYWLPETVDDLTWAFDAIAPDQAFYITDDGKLVISFDEAVVAPAYMGIVEFTIPTEVIADELVSDEYIH